MSAGAQSDRHGGAITEGDGGGCTGVEAAPDRLRSHCPSTVSFCGSRNRATPAAASSAHTASVANPYSTAVGKARKPGAAVLRSASQPACTVGAWTSKASTGERSTAVAACARVSKGPIPCTSVPSCRSSAGCCRRRANVAPTTATRQWRSPATGAVPRWSAPAASALALKWVVTTACSCARSSAAKAPMACPRSVSWRITARRRTSAAVYRRWPLVVRSGAVTR